MRYSAFYEEEERHKERTTSSEEKATAENINKTQHTTQKWKQEKHEREGKNLRNPRLIRSFVYEMCVYEGEKTGMTTTHNINIYTHTHTDTHTHT